MLYCIGIFINIWIKENIKTIMHDPKLQNILQDILHEANQFLKNLISKQKIIKKQIIASEIMKTFYKAIHTKMFKKRSI